MRFLKDDFVPEPPWVAWPTKPEKAGRYIYLSIYGDIKIAVWLPERNEFWDGPVMMDGIYAPAGLVPPVAWSELPVIPDFWVEIDGRCELCEHFLPNAGHGYHGECAISERAWIAPFNSHLRYMKKTDLCKKFKESNE